MYKRQEFKESDIEVNMSIEASQYIPYPIEEVYLDFEVKGPSQANSEMQDVMLVASRRENVDTREAAIKEEMCIRDSFIRAGIGARPTLFDHRTVAGQGVASVQHERRRSILGRFGVVLVVAFTVHGLKQGRGHRTCLLYTSRCV